MRPCAGTRRRRDLRVWVLHDGPYPSRSGGSMMALQLRAALSDRGYRALLAMPDTPAARAEEGVVFAGGLTGPELLRNLGNPPDLIHVVDLARPRAVSATSSAARTLGVPWVITAATAEEAWEAPDLVRKAGRQAQAILALTRAEGDRLRRAFGPGPEVRVIGHYAQPATPQPANGAAAFRAEYGIHSAIVLFLGRKVASKGYRELLRAAPLVCAEIPEVRFVFIGPRTDPDCDSWFARLGGPAVLELPFVALPKREAALAACNVLVLPSNVDVFPLAITEAWAHGKPVIAGPFCGADEVVRHGIDGLLVDQTAESIAPAIIKILRYPARARRLGRNGKARLSLELSLDRVMDRVEATYQALMQRGQP